MESIDALQGALERFSGGVITVSHDERFINSVCNEIWICEDGLLKKFAGTIKDYKVSMVEKEKVEGKLSYSSPSSPFFILAIDCPQRSTNGTIEGSIMKVAKFIYVTCCFPKKMCVCVCHWGGCQLV